MMMEDVIYGVIFNANTDMFKNEPPVTASKKLNPSAVWFLNHSENTLPSTPGIGS